MYTNVSSTPSDSSNSPPIEGDGSTTPPLQENEAIIGIQSEDGINNGGVNRHPTTHHGLMSTFRRGKAQLHTLIPTPSPPILVSQPGSGSGYSPLLFASHPPPSVSSSFQLLPLPPSSFSQTQLPSHSHLSHETPSLPSTSLESLHSPPLPSTSQSPLRFRPQQPPSISSPSSSQVSLPSYPYLPPYALPPSSLAQPQTHVASFSVSQSSSPQSSRQSSSPASPFASQISLPPHATGGREGVLPHFPFPSHLNASTSSFSDDHPHPLDTASFYTEDEGPTTGGLGEANEMYHLFPARVRNQVSSGFILRAGGGSGGGGGVKAKEGGGKEGGGGGEIGSPSTGRERAESIWADSGDVGIWGGDGMEGSRVMLVDGDGPENTRWFESLRAADKQIKKLNRRKKPFWIDVRDISSEDIKLLETDYGVHALTAEDLLEKEAREKTETFDEYRCLVVHEPFVGEGHVYLQPYILLIYSQFAITVRSSPTSVSLSDNPLHTRNNSLEALKSIREARSGMPQPAWVMYAILDCIIDSYIPIVSGLASESGLLDQLALTLSPDDQQDFLTRIRMERSKLARVRTTLLVKREILSQLTARGYVSFLDDLTKMYLRDVIDELHQLLSKLDVTAATFNSFPSTFLARLSADSGATAAKVGILMRTFAVISGIFVLLTLVTAIFGMNVKIPGNGEELDNFIMFGTICGCFGMFGVVFLGVGRRLKWI